MLRLVGPAKKEARQAEGEARVRIEGLEVIAAALWDLAIESMALGWARGVIGHGRALGGSEVRGLFFFFFFF